MKFSEEFTREKLSELGIEKISGFVVRGALGKITTEEFKKLDDKDFDNIRGIGVSKKEKLIWLRDYLNGKVSGKYEKEIGIESAEIQRLKNIIKNQEKKEMKLFEKISVIESENSKMKEELKELRKKAKAYEKMREYFLSEE